ncbi:MAG: aspartate aminotransferase family protein [Dehalococcoidales bacterium]|nr:aspartate aminotransferase family protein [Dehalococcoidales bacterium]
MRFDTKELGILEEALKRMEGGFSALPEIDGGYDYAGIRTVLLETADKMRDNYPYFHPFYAGQMLKPPHPAARLAYMLSLWINPNNHAIDGGRASSQMEKEAVAAIAAMFGWKVSLGHICSGGTMANLEALWAGGKLNPNKVVAASEMAHYTHSRISEVLKLPFQAVPCNSLGQMDPDVLESVLKTGRVGMVVATLGTTGTGSIDPLPDILRLREKYPFRLHVDSAYGGYFTLADNLGPAGRKAFDLLKEADSIVVDPHKHGLQPYGCGCVLFKDPSIGVLYKHDSPYTYFSSNELHLGEISLECSRPGAAAAALWATQKLLPMVRGGEFAAGLARSRDAALEFYRRIKADGRFRTMMDPELDIVVWAPKAGSESEVSRLSQEIFEAAARRNLHLATFKYPVRLLRDKWKDVHFENEYVTCLRSCLMKPEHLEWLDRLWDILDRATGEALGTAGIT